VRHSVAIVLISSWKRILLTTTVDGKVSIRAIAKTFASGKTEKLVYESLAELDLPSGKVTPLNPLIMTPSAYIPHKNCNISIRNNSNWLKFYITKLITLQGHWHTNFPIDHFRTNFFPTDHSFSTSYFPIAELTELNIIRFRCPNRGLLLPDPYRISPSGILG